MILLLIQRFGRYNQSSKFVYLAQRCYEIGKPMIWEFSKISQHASEERSFCYNLL